MEWTTHHGQRANRIPGQVPRLDAQLDAMFVLTPQVHIAESLDAPRPILRAEMVAGDLGLPDHVERNITQFVKHEAPIAGNEVAFRRSVMMSLFEQRLDPTARRMVLSRALNYYRNTTSSSTSPHIPSYVIEPLQRAAAPRGGRYHRRVPKPGGGYEYIYDEHEYKKRPDAHLDGKEAQHNYLKDSVRKLIGDEGCHVTALADHVKRHGSKAVGDAVRAHADLELVDGHLRPKKKDTAKAQRTADIEFVIEKAGLVPLAPASGNSHVTQGISPKALPPGAKRIWHNRIVQKQADEKWHVVGHVAGLEESKRKPQDLKPHEIHPDHLKELIAKIRALEHHERQQTK
jgi:hypothetical protein